MGKNTEIHTSTNQEYLAKLKMLIDEKIPLSRAMEIELLDYQQGILRARAPLAPNINDKGTAFGGSQAALMTLVAWGLVWLETRKKGVDCDIVIHKGEMIWHRPLCDEIKISCSRPEQQALDTFFTTLSRRGKAGLNLTVISSDGNNIYSEYNCRYVGLKKEIK